MEQVETIIYEKVDTTIVLTIERVNKQVWATQKQLAELFNVDIATVNEHLKDIFESGELQENSVIRNFLITASDDKEYDVMHYNLPAIIAVGYRINSDEAIMFRKWVDQQFKD